MTQTTKTAHTPGPWKATIAETGGFVIQAAGHVICNRAPIEHAADESAANAHLIEAAPDLLSTLKDVLRIARAASVGITGNRKRIAAAEAAIANASGGAT